MRPDRLHPSGSSRSAAGPSVVRRRRGQALPPNTVYVGRPTVYGNPWQVGTDGTRDEVIERYRDWLYAPELRAFRERVRRDLRGKDLACWCAPEACHADVLLELANSDGPVHPRA